MSNNPIHGMMDEFKNAMELHEIRKSNSRWYKINFEGIATKYDKEYVAIENRSVIEHDKDEEIFFSKMKSNPLYNPRSTTYWFVNSEMHR
jgi:hypothetical protein